MQDGVIIAVAEEERFNRKKHGKKARCDKFDELPLHSIHYCLKTAGIDLDWTLDKKEDTQLLKEVGYLWFSFLNIFLVHKLFS
ncbi:hypothetical protein [aff. Roholtiella sp. LEGE 12411]|uniref:hypothetical protein n=1 Tax=aff. Roholtiella sp. LEGE 12411 TaxID=1828822 RepID=UPI001FC86D6F|nr:hypothetical protein [aff. Roholtiella sp. LEGE 12411]